MTIPYRLSKIETKQFAMFPDKFTGEKVVVNTELSFTASTDRKNIRSIVTLKYQREESLLMILELACYFDIAPEGWDEIKDGNQWKVPVDFLRYMGTIVVGTARGVLYAKTEGTALNASILPPINLVELIKDDYVVTDKSK